MCEKEGYITDKDRYKKNEVRRKITIVAPTYDLVVLYTINNEVNTRCARIRTPVRIRRKRAGEAKLKKNLRVAITTAPTTTLLLLSFPFFSPI